MYKIKPTKMRPQYHELQLRDLALWLHIGCTAEERKTVQEVRLNIYLRLYEMPPGALSDQLSETICYGELAQAIRNQCQTKEYLLLERLGLEVYTLCKEKVNGMAEVLVATSKVKPPVEHLLGGSHYHCGDFQL